MKAFLRATLVACASLLGAAASAGPGAHGPGGEHLDGPAPVLSAGARVPRAEAKSESFELVARIEGGTLSILIDRYDTNEPVLDAVVEVEMGTAKQKAVFRREQGDYAITDPVFVKLASSPGSHTLVFTVSAGKDSDLLDATMQVAGEEGHGKPPWYAGYPTLAALIGGALVVAGVVIVLLRRRAARTIGFSRGAR